MEYSKQDMVLGFGTFILMACTFNLFIYLIVMHLLILFYSHQTVNLTKKLNISCELSGV